MTSLIDQIKELHERDYGAPRLMAKPGELPLDYEAITPEWLTDLMCKGAPGAKVTALSLGEPDDGSANRRRIHIQYNSVGDAAGLPKSVFCKASHDLPHRINLGVCGCAEAETGFYRNVRPTLDIDCPIAYYADYDDRSFNSLIVLHDIGDEVVFNDAWTPINSERIHEQLRLLAKLHTWTGARAGKAALGLQTWPDFFDRVCDVSGSEPMMTGFEAAVAEGVVPARLFQRIDEVWPATLEAVDIHRRLPAGVVHGDCHLKQWFVRGTDQMGVSDWQCASLGNWSRDVPYMMASSLEIEDRRKWERDLLKFYLETVREMGGEAPDFDTAWTLYRQNLLSALAWWTGTLVVGAEQPEMQPRDTSIQFIKRISTALDDLDGLDARY